jgi:hypothetical protein
MQNLGARVYGLAAIVMGVAGIVWGGFAVDWMPVPAKLPGRLALAYAVGALLIAGGALINWRRFSYWGAALLTAIFAIGLVLLDVARIPAHWQVFGSWDSSAEQLAVTVGGLVAFAASAPIGRPLASMLTRAGRLIFGVCLLSFGAAHFVYMGDTWPLVPVWLPPSQVFWAYLTGIAAIAAGLALLSGVLALLAMQLLTAMYVIFGILVHARLLIAHPASHGVLIENALNLALVGVAWIMADSLAARRR